MTNEQKLLSYERMKNTTLASNDDESMIVVCKSFDDAGDDVACVKAQEIRDWKEKHEKDYRALAKVPAIRKMAAGIFRHYTPEGKIFRDKSEIERLRCDKEERRKEIEKHPKTFEEWQKQFLIYILAWEDDSLWQIVLYLLDEMCGPPYDAQHTIYEYLSGTNQTRTNFELVFESQTQELNIKPGSGVHRYEQVVVSHNNPFGGPYSYDSKELLVGHRNILYIFGHVSHETMTRNDRKESGCTFLDIDTSPKSVTVIALDDYLKN